MHVVETEPASIILRLIVGSNVVVSHPKEGEGALWELRVVMIEEPEPSSTQSCRKEMGLMKQKIQEEVSPFN